MLFGDMFGFLGTCFLVLGLLIAVIGWLIGTAAEKIGKAAKNVIEDKDFQEGAKMGLEWWLRNRF